MSANNMSPDSTSPDMVVELQTGEIPVEISVDDPVHEYLKLSGRGTGVLGELLKCDFDS